MSRRGTAVRAAFVLAAAAVTLAIVGADPALTAPPVNGKIAFPRPGGHDSLWTMNADGSNPASFFGLGTAFNIWPAWSPDGTKLAWSATDANGNYDIYVINADLTGGLRLTTDTDTETAPAWSPDGTKLAYARRGADGDSIWVMNAATGANQTRIAGAGITGGGAPAWSPDGTSVAFQGQTVPPCAHDGDPGCFLPVNDDIYVVGATGGAVTQLTTDTDDDLSPAWSGSTLAYSRASHIWGGHDQRRRGAALAARRRDPAHGHPPCLVAGRLQVALRA